MLHVQKNNLVTGLSKKQVEIRQLEVDWYCNNYSMISGQAAMLLGFALGQLTTPMPEAPEPPFNLELSYLTLTSLAVGLELTAIIVSTFLSTWAPSLALRGARGSADLHKAVDALRDYQGMAFLCFMFGWVVFFISSICQVWIYFRRRVAFVVTFPLVGFVLLVIWYTIDITSTLRLDDREAVAGKIDHFHAYEGIADLDTGLHTWSGPQMRSGGMADDDDDEDLPGHCPMHRDFTPALASERATRSAAPGGGGGLELSQMRTGPPMNSSATAARMLMRNP